MGYVIAVLLNDVVKQALSLNIFALGSMFLGIAALLWLPRLGVRSLGIPKSLIPRAIPKSFIGISIALVAFGIGFELCQPLIVVNLFISIAKNPLLGLALYEAFAALPIVVLSPIVLRVDKKLGLKMLALGMSLISLSDLALGFAYRIEVALLAAIMASAGYAIMDPLFMDVLFATIPEEYRGAMLGFLASSRRLIGIVMPAIAGAIAEIQAHLPFIIASIAVAISAFLTLSVARKRYFS